MKLKIISDGTIPGTKVINAETGESIDNVQSFVITAYAKKGIVEATIKLVHTEFDMVVEKKKRVRKPKYPDSTAYSKNCIESYKKTIMEGEGLVDLEYVENHGINPDDRLSWCMWQYFTKVYSENKLIKIKVPDIVEFIRGEVGGDHSEIEFKFDRTTANHSINKFCFIGLLNKHKKSDECFYTFSNSVKRRGLEFFRKDNHFMRGHFQSDSNGIFNLMEEIK